MAAAPLHLPELGADASREYRLGIMGGTFDPIHYGHLVTAEQAREALELDLVLFMPAGRPAFKLDEDVSDAEREGVTYTIDTLRALRAYYPDNVKLFFITGADAILDLATWHDAEGMAELATFIAATRPGYDIDQARARLANSGVAFDVRYIEIPALAISSTNIRERVSRGKSVRYLTSESVIGYIRKNGLYNRHVIERVDGAQAH